MNSERKENEGVISVQAEKEELEIIAGAACFSNEIVTSVY